MTTHTPAYYEKRIARLAPNNTPRHIRCYDNGGATIDRYTVVFTHTGNDGHMYVAMSADPFWPQGFCQHGSADRAYPIDYPTHGHLGKKITFDKLPDDCQTVVRQDYAQLWELEPAH